MARGERRQNLARLGEIAQVAARHGFGYAFGRKEVPPEALEEGAAGLSRGRRVREMLDELGPTFVKFGQLLSTRPDIVPPDILEELRGLQDDAHPEPFEHVRAVVEAELGLTIEQVFAEFDEQPIAAASIGQVHRARLPGGQEVVVKVQRPDAERQISADIQLLYQAAKVARDRIRKLQFIDLVETVDEFARTIRRELDYGIEARNAEVFRRNFAGDETVSVPKVYWRYTTARVLTMERVEGTSLRQLDLDQWSAADRVSLANRITQTWMQMVFVHGFFHADPHPANILVRDPNSISVVDCGMTEQLTQRDREALVRLMIDIINQDAERLPRRLRALGVRFPRAKEEELADRLAVIVQRYSAIADRRHRHPRGAEGDLRHGLRDRRHTPGALGDARQDRRHPGRGRARDLARLRRLRGRPPLRPAADGRPLPPRPDRRAAAVRRRAATPRRCSTTRSRSRSCSTSSRTATSRSASSRRGSRRRSTSWRPASNRLSPRRSSRRPSSSAPR